MSTVQTASNWNAKTHLDANPRPINIYDARWMNAIRIHTRLNKLLDEGYIIIKDDEHWEYENKYCSKFVITEKNIVEDKCYVYFINDIDLDNGMHTKIKDYNKQFENWKAYHPKDIKSVSKLIK